MRLLNLLLLVFPVYFICCEWATAGMRPNVLFLVTDDQRADTIGALGNDAIRTPNLDKLVKQGFVFKNAYCMGATMGAVCNPSRHMFLSGKALYHYDPKVKENTFGDVMRRLGYITFHISKRGNTARNYHKAFEISDYLNDQKERTSGHHGQTAVNAGIEFLTKTWKKDRPFFMYIGFAGPHDPRVAAKKWMSLYDREKIPLPKNYMPFHPFNNGELKVRDEKLAPWPRTEETVKKHLHDYYACISSIDYHIGRLMQTLKDIGEYENTIIIFTSDHGLAIGSHGLFGKQSLYGHSMNSPLIFAGPGVPHGYSDALAYLFDIFPTAVDLVGGKIPPGLDGNSLRPIIEGKSPRVRDSVFLSYRDVQRAVRKGDWKLIRYPKVDVTQLFDLKSDPYELNNLAEKSNYQPKVKELMSELEKLQKHFHDKAPLTVADPQAAKVDLEFFQTAIPKKKKKKQELPISALQQEKPQPTRKIAYRNIEGKKLYLHVFEPKGEAKKKDRPAIVFFFGGGWNGGTPQQFYPHCAYLASRGMMAMSAEYRVKSRDKTTPFECVEDGKAALRYIRKHSKELGIDPNKIAAGGGSAGGHVAAAVATVPNLNGKGDDLSVSPIPNALVLFNPVYDNGPNGYGYERVKKRFKEISPIHNINKGMPPAIVFLGTKDNLIPVKTAKSFQESMQEVGSRSELMLFEGATHGFFNFGRGDGSAYRRTVHAMDVFLTSLGFLEGKPTIKLDQ